MNTTNTERFCFCFVCVHECFSDLFKFICCTLFMENVICDIERDSRCLIVFCTVSNVQIYFCVFLVSRFIVRGLFFNSAFLLYTGGLPVKNDGYPSPCLHCTQLLGPLRCCRMANDITCKCYRSTDTYTYVHTYIRTYIQLIVFVDDGLCLLVACDWLHAV
jgi:hypothetical protein